jgi:hypothetical protein
MSDVQLGGEDERRAHERVRVERTVHIAATGFSWSCQLIDVTSAGARVAFDHNAAWPDKVVLHDPELGLAFRCRIAWRSTTDVGLEFIESGAFEQLVKSAF